MFWKSKLIEVGLRITLSCNEDEDGRLLMTGMYKNILLSGVPRPGDFILGFEILEMAEVKDVNWMCGGGVLIELIGNGFADLPDMISFEQMLINDGWKGADPYHGYTEAKQNYIKKHGYPDN
ncbi:MAG: hypothetical protein CME32_03895 [Gimesia sp.]|nr:hypothetical protein [Gimesia sp.]